MILFGALVDQGREEGLPAVEAQERLIILSSWINLETCNEELCRYFARDLLQGVRLQIGYFLEKDRILCNAAYYQRNVKEVINAIKRQLNRQNPTPSIDLRNVIVQARGTRQNILVCDTWFGIAGSFQGLSSTGEGKRTELSVLFCNSDQVNELAQIALRAWNLSK